MTQTTQPFAIQRVNPLDYEAEIKALFALEGPNGAFFAPFFDSAYRQAVADGAWSWIGRNGRDQVVMHIGCFPHRFLAGQRTVKAGLTVNLMVEKSYRQLWPALSLLRQVVADTRELDFDFLYADPNEAGRAVLNVAGFSVFAHLQRFVFPLGGRTRAQAFAAFAYRLFDRLTHPLAPRIAISSSGTSVPMSAANPVPQDSRWIVPLHSQAVYQRRVPGFPAANDYWFIDRVGGYPEVAIMVRGPDGAGTAVVHTIRATKSDGIAPVLRGVAHGMRGLGAIRLETWTLKESSMASDVRTAGFLGRHEVVPVVALAHTEAGRSALQTPAHWRITHVDCDR